MMLFNDCKFVVLLFGLIGTHQIFAVDVLGNAEVDDKSSNVTKREEKIEGRARKSFVFKDNDDYGDYSTGSGTGYGSNNDYGDYNTNSQSQGVRGGRYYNTDKAIKFPVDDARESLSSVIDDANYNYGGVYNSIYNNNNNGNSDNNRVKGGRGLLFPYETTNNGVDQYGSQYNNYESESVRGQQQLNSYGQPAISSSPSFGSSSSSAAQPYKFVDPYSHKRYENEDPSQQKLQTQEYIQKLEQQQQYLLHQKQQQDALRLQQQQQQYLLQQQQQQNHGYNPQSQLYRPPVESSFPGPYSPEFLQQHHSSFPGSTSHHHPSVAQAFPGTFGSNPNLHIGPFPPPGNYKLPNGVEISFTPPPGFAGPDHGPPPIIHSQPPRPQSPPGTYQHLYENPFQSPYAPDRIGHPHASQYASQFGNYGAQGGQFPGPLSPALLQQQQGFAGGHPGLQGPPPHYGGALNPHQLGVIGGIGAINGPQGFGHSAFAPQGGRPPYGGGGGLFDAVGRQPEGGIGRRVSRAIEEISKNDDLQCVPQMVCKMVGSRMRERPIPGFIDVGSLGTLIEAIPVETPAAVYMRAALLGLTNGDRRCYHAYKRCPNNEDDVLYYLNNHRGGFFRFFSGEDNTLNDQQSGSNYHHHQQQQQSDSGLGGLLSLLMGGGSSQGESPQSQLNALALQQIAAALGTTTTAQRPQRDPPQQGGFNLGSLSGLASNFQLLSTLGSLFGGGGNSFGRSKETEITGRQANSDKIEEKEDYSQLKDVDFSKVIQNMIKSFAPTNATETKESSDRTKRDTIQVTTLVTPVSTPETHARIVNKPIYSYIPDPGHANRYQSTDQFYQQSNTITDDDRYYQNNNHQQRITPDQIPIKTGTGSLAFSHEQFNKRYYENQKYLLQQQLQEELDREQKDRQAEQDRLNQLSNYYTNTHRFQYNSGSRPSSSSSYNRYSYTRYPSGSSSNNNYNRYQSSSSNYNSGGGGGNGNRIYVTNAQGVNEYYLENGRKHYI